MVVIMMYSEKGEILWVHILYFITMIIFNGCTIDVARKARIEIDGEPISFMTEQTELLVHNSDVP